jgi:asparagine synthase (glutamine-hydrolysing)
MGVWLSGGLDSTAVTALAARGTDRPLPTFVAGLAGSGDLRFAREAASILKTDHHEVIVMPERLRQVLPEVIEALESFDPLLVRSSLMHYLAAQEASRWVEGAFSGEGNRRAVRRLCLVEKAFNRGPGSRTFAPARETPPYRPSAS